MVVEASDDTPLYVEVHGRGVPFVLSCAFCTTHENWRSQVEPLTGHKLIFERRDVVVFLQLAVRVFLLDGAKSRRRDKKLFTP